jgi:SAM-dependent methyltransferase
MDTRTANNFDLYIKRERPNLILEVGAGSSGELSSHIRSRRRCSYISLDLDMSLEYRRSDICVRGDISLLPFSDGQFDSVVCTGVLEHLIELDLALQEIFRVLRAGGSLALRFGPVWTSALGHHLSVACGSKEARFYIDGRNVIPSWGHLIMDRCELASFLESGPCEAELATRVVDFVHDSPKLGRNDWRSYWRALHLFRLEIAEFTYTLPPTILTAQKLRALMGSQRFDVSHAWMVLRKPSKRLTSRLTDRVQMIAARLSHCRTGFDDRGYYFSGSIVPRKKFRTIASGRGAPPRIFRGGANRGSPLNGGNKFLVSSDPFQNQNRASWP